ncbi:hypothetical protein FHR98_001178 [Limibacillus halophilus]|uniref:Signal transducing protein n=1 Tax=Limibacillus halophilus TaxID=1579333 RepID=A0A839SSD9_9PROT|nr:hypothetical protein [Limibacillus halophilus]
MPGLATLTTCADLNEARSLRALLEDAGFFVFLPEEHHLSTVWFHEVATGVRLQVEADSLQAAQEFFQAVQEEISQPDRGTHQSNTGSICPACGGADIHRGRSLLAGIAGLVLAGLPLVLGTRKRLCRRCGHTWKSQARA